MTAALLALALLSGPRFHAEGTFALALPSDGTGALEAGPGFGVRGGATFPEGNWLLGAGLSVLTTTWTEGPSALRVDTRLTYVAVPLSAGVDLVASPLVFAPYLQASPLLVVTSVGYAVRDPLGPGPRESSAAGQSLGGALGAGLLFATAGDLGLQARLEASLLRRAGTSDALVSLGLGAAF